MTGGRRGEKYWAVEKKWKRITLEIEGEIILDEIDYVLPSSARRDGEL